MTVNDETTPHVAAQGRPFATEAAARQDPALLSVWREEILDRMRGMVGQNEKRVQLFARISATDYQSYVREAVRVGILADMHDSWAQEDHRLAGDPRIAPMLSDQTVAELRATLREAPCYGLTGDPTLSLTQKSRSIVRPLFLAAEAIWEEDVGTLRHDQGFILGGGILLPYVRPRARISRPSCFIGTPLPWNTAIFRADGAIELLRINLEPLGLSVSLDQGSLD